MIVHTIPPVFDKSSRILVLGSFPSPKSRESGFFYGHRQNRFWRVISAVLGEEEPGTNEEKRAMVLRNHIAMWDVLHSCDINGASDSSIRSAVPNDFSEILETADIRAVFTTGRTATELYNKLCLGATGIPTTYLPSTSAANRARFSVDELIAEYGVIMKALRV